MKKILVILALFINTFTALPQTDGPVAEKAVGLAANDKIWVVMTICVVILLGLLAYLVRLDRKISRLEKSQNPSG